MGVQDSFGADVKLTLPEQRQLFVVVFASREVGPAAIIRAHGGRIVVDGGAWVVAELGFNVATSLRSAQEVVFVGGVSVDPQRLAAFGKVTGLDPFQPQER